MGGFCLLVKLHREGSALGCKVEVLEVLWSIGQKYFGVVQKNDFFLTREGGGVKQKVIFMTGVFKESTQSIFCPSNLTFFLIQEPVLA